MDESEFLDALAERFDGDREAAIHALSAVLVTLQTAAANEESIDSVGIAVLAQAALRVSAEPISINLTIGREAASDAPRDVSPDRAVEVTRWLADSAALSVLPAGFDPSGVARVSAGLALANLARVREAVEDLPRRRDRERIRAALAALTERQEEIQSALGSDQYTALRAWDEFVAERRAAPPADPAAEVMAEARRQADEVMAATRRQAAEVMSEVSRHAAEIMEMTRRAARAANKAEARKFPVKLPAKKSAKKAPVRKAPAKRAPAKKLPPSMSAIAKKEDKKPKPKKAKPARRTRTTGPSASTTPDDE